MSEIQERGDAVVVPKVQITVLERVVEPERKGLGRGILSTLRLIEEHGWPISALSTTLVHYTDEFYASDSKLKPGQETPDHSKGDLKTPEHTKRFWWIAAGYPDFYLGMDLKWREGQTPKGGRSFQFQTAHCADPFGMPTEFFANYEMSSDDLKQVKDEPEWAHQDRKARLERLAIERDRRYNDGRSWLNRRPMFKAWGDFDAWFTEALTMTATKREEIAA